jgi:hypothetical protein
LDEGLRTMTNASEIDPNAIALIPDYSNDSLRIVAQRLEHSTRFQHYILRADELDAVWRHLDAALKDALERADAHTQQLQPLLEAVREAHQLVTDGSPLEAAARLRAAMH